jgi:hypothetical protein
MVMGALMMLKGKTLLIVLAVTGFARVAIFAIPVVAVYFGMNSNSIEKIEDPT